MSPDVQDSEDPQEWLRFARSDLALAGTEPVGDVLPATLCFHAQQAAEKAIKAVLVKHRVVFPWTHSIPTLISLVVGDGVDWPDELRAATKLTDYAVVSRYPWTHEDIGDEELKRAVSLAHAVMVWAEAEIGVPPTP